MGAHVTIAGRSLEPGKGLVDELDENATHLQADVTDEEQVAAAAGAPRGLRLAVSVAGAAIVAKTIGRDRTAHPIDGFQHIPRALAYPLAFAAGAVLASVIDTLAPEAFNEGGPTIALASAAGFLTGFLLSV